MKNVYNIINNTEYKQNNNNKYNNHVKMPSY